MEDQLIEDVAAPIQRDSNGNVSPDGVPKNMQVEQVTVPEKKKSGFKKLLTGVLAIGAAAVTFQKRTTNSKVDKLLEDGFLISDDTDAIGYIKDIHKQANEKFPDSDFEPALDKAKKGAAKVNRSFAYRLIDPRISFLSDTYKDKKEVRKFAKPYLKNSTILSRAINNIAPENRGNGIINTVLRIIPATIGAGISTIEWVGKKGLETARVAAFDFGGNRGDRKDQRAFDKLDDVANNFADDVRKTAAKSGSFVNSAGETEKIKLDTKTHVKNGAVAIAVGAVVYGGTMLVDKFIEKRREKAKAQKAQHAAQFELEKEIAMISPKSQISTSR